jgi:hypothetical protein
MCWSKQGEWKCTNPILQKRHAHLCMLAEQLMISQLHWHH